MRKLALIAFAAACGATQPRLPVDEAGLNKHGYELLYKQHRVADAVAVFEHMAAAFPASANAHDSLGEAYLVAERFDDAAREYLHSLRLDPRNRNAVAMLARVWVTRPDDGWTDRSRHQSQFVSANGVRLHYLDWGGTGLPIVLLAGMGNSAHIFDGLAPRLLERHRVLALTRRGHGESEAPATGYDTATLVADVREFLDAVHVDRAVLVGHSIAGDELTRFAAQYPARVAALVYLDAAADRSDLTDDQIFAAMPDVFRKLEPALHDTLSYTMYRDWTARARFGGVWSDALEADLRTTRFDARGRMRSALRDDVAAALNAGTRAAHPDFGALRVPVLSFHATFSLANAFPWLTCEATAERAQAERYLADVIVPRQHRQAERIRREVPGSRVIELDAGHYFFIAQEADVAGAIHQLVASVGDSSQASSR